MNIAFDAKRVLVTGADHGIGRAIARCFADRGARVVACGLHAASLEETAAGRMATGVVDVGDREAVRRYVAGIGAVDILVNNAGGVAGQTSRPIEEVTPEALQAIMNANAIGCFNMSQAVAPAMKAGRSGRIVNISSGAGLRPSLTGIQAYTMAKHAVVGLTRQLALELGPFGITVNSVAPGFVRSNPSTERQWEAYGPEGQKRLVENIHLRRLGTAEDIMHAALFFASDYASWVSGEILQVNGGRA